MFIRTFRQMIVLAAFVLAASSLAAAQTPAPTGNFQRAQATLSSFVFEQKSRTTDAVERVVLSDFMAGINSAWQANALEIYDAPEIWVTMGTPYIAKHGKLIPGLGVKPDELPGRQQNFTLNLLAASREKLTVSVQFNDRPAVTVELRANEVAVVPVGPLDRKVEKPAYLALLATGVDSF